MKCDHCGKEITSLAYIELKPRVRFTQRVTNVCHKHLFRNEQQRQAYKTRLYFHDTCFLDYMQVRGKVERDKEGFRTRVINEVTK